MSFEEYVMFGYINSNLSYSPKGLEIFEAAACKVQKTMGVNYNYNVPFLKEYAQWTKGNTDA